MNFEFKKNQKVTPIKESEDSKITINAIVPEEPSVMRTNDKLTKKIVVKIEGILGDNDSLFYASELDSTLNIEDVTPGEQYEGIRVLLKEESNVKQEETYEEYVITISNWQECCEVWGAFLSEDDLSRFIGSELIDIYFTDVSLNTEYLKIIASYKDYLHLHNVQFVNFKTNRGTFQFTVYNCHNGYYGHDITVTYNGEELYKGNI